MEIYLRLRRRILWTMKHIAHWMIPFYKLESKELKECKFRLYYYRGDIPSNTRYTIYYT